MHGNPIKGLIVGTGAMAAVVSAAWVSVSACSCTALPREGSHTTVITNAVRIVAEVAVQVKEARDAAVEDAQPGETPSAGGPTASTTAAPANLVFRFGGVDGSRAVEDPNAQIADLRMTKSGMTYRWAAGGCENLGAKDRGDYSRTLACAFYWSEKEQAWIGGKFDFVSTSRTTRSWNNINDGYRRWDAKAFFAAPKRAFCIVSTDGRKRTNLLETEEPK